MEPAGESWVEPGRRYIIKRPRLTRLLDQTKARVRMLIAPAGYGKTTLAREWLENRPHAWYQGTAATADVAALAAGLAKTAATVIPGAGRRMIERLRATGMPDQEAELLAELFVSDLADWPHDTWLVIDDYQFAADSQASEQFVRFIADHTALPLFVTSRVRPTWATSRRLLYGEILELGQNQLAMSQEEGAEVLARHPDEAPGLIALAEGWPAVIGLAALTQEEFEPPEDSIPDALYNYFAEELYQTADLNIQRGLCQLAFMSSISPALAEAALGESAAEVLGKGVRLGALVPSRRAYEIHPLLKRFLRSKLQEESDESIEELVYRLGVLFVDRRLWDDAFSVIEHFYSESLFTQLLSNALPSMLNEARLPTLHRWLGHGREHQLDSAVTNVAEAEIAVRAGDRKAAEVLSLRAIDMMSADHPLASRAFSLSGFCAHMTYRDEVARDRYQKARSLAKSTQDILRAQWGEFLALVALGRPEAEAALDEFSRHQGKGPDDCLQLANGKLMLALMHDSFRAELEVAEGMTAILPNSTDPLIRSSFLNTYASALVLAARYDAARETADVELAEAEEYRLDFVIPHGAMYKAAALVGLREFRNCKKYLDQAERLQGDPADRFFASNCVSIRARMHIATGEVEQAAHLMETNQDVPVTPDMQAEYEAWWSLILACGGETHQASQLANAAEAASNRVEVRGITPAVRAIVAVRHKARDTQQKVLAALRIAQQTGNFDGLVAAYRGCPPILEYLAQSSRDLPLLVALLQRARDDKLGTAAGVIMPVPNPLSAESLTKREREVQLLLRHGLKNREIARVLFISESTVKVHLRHIYEKLGVRSRTEAAVLGVSNEQDLSGAGESRLRI